MDTTKNKPAEADESMKDVRSETHKMMGKQLRDKFENAMEHHIRCFGGSCDLFRRDKNHLTREVIWSRSMTIWKRC